PRQGFSSGCHPHTDDARGARRLSSQSFCDLENSQLAEQARVAVAAKTSRLTKTEFRAHSNRTLYSHSGPARSRMDHSPHDPPRPLTGLLHAYTFALLYFSTGSRRIRLL